MKLTKPIFMGTGAVVLAGLTLGLLTPKAAHALAAAAVLVENTTSSPVPNQDVDQPGRHAFIQSCSASSSTGCNMVPAIPAGNVFVVQTLTATQIYSVTTNPAALFYGISTHGSSAQVILNSTQEANVPQVFLTSSNLTFYQDPGTTPLCSTNDATISISCFASGYLVSVP